MLDKILELLNKIAGSLSDVSGQSNLLIGLVVYILFILTYSGFFWNFNKIISKKDFRINFIERYFDEKTEGFGRAMKWIFELVKYFIVLPIVILFWFMIFALFFLFLSKTSDVGNILLISAAMIISIRIIAFSQEDLSRNIAKIIPFTLLALFIISPSFSDLAGFLTKANLIKDLINSSQDFLILILLAEIVLRGFYFASKTIHYARVRKEEVVVKKHPKRIMRIRQ